MYVNQCYGNCKTQNGFREKESFVSFINDSRFVAKKKEATRNFFLFVFWFYCFVTYQGHVKPFGEPTQTVPGLKSSTITKSTFASNS